MSGGSHNYLCYKDSDALIDAESDIEGMIERIAELSPIQYSKAQMDSIQILEDIRALKARINALDTGRATLTHVWRQVEWADSSDISEDDAIKAIVDYQNK